MHKIICLFTFFFFNAHFAQTYVAKTDSIAKLKIDQLYPKVVKEAGSNPEKAILLAKEMIAYKDKYTISSSDLCNGYQWLGIAYRNTGKLDSAIISFEKGFTHARAVPTLDNFPAILKSASSSYLQRGKKEELMKLFLELLDKIEVRKKSNLKLFRNPKNEHCIEASVYTSMIRINTSLGEREKQKQLAQKALSLVKSSTNNYDNITKSFCLQYLGELHRLESRPDSALFYYNKLLDIDHKIIGANSVNLAKKSIAGIWITENENLDRAEKLLLEVLQDEKASNHRRQAETYDKFARLYRQKRLYDKELVYLNKARVLYEEHKNQENIVNTYMNLALAYAKQDDFEKEQEYKTKFWKAHRTEYNLEKNKAVLELEAKYESSKKQSEIDHQKQLVDEQRKQKNFFIIGAILFGALFVISIFLYRQRLKVQKLLFLNQQDLNKERMNSLVETQKLENINSYIEGQNKERKRISKDLHDGVGGNLAAIKMKLEKLSESQSQKLDTIIDSIENTYDEVRSISHNLVPKTIQFNHFTDLLRQFIDHSVKNEVGINYQFYPKDQLNDIPEELQLTIYRILQELITNISKHAQATDIFVNLIIHENDRLNILVEDNGKGFDPEKNSEGIGLNSVKERVEKLGGSISVDSHPKIGTTVNINFQVK